MPVGVYSGCCTPLLYAAARPGRHGPGESPPRGCIDQTLQLPPSEEPRMVATMTDVTSDTAPFSAAAAEAILVAACELTGLESSDARLLRLGENALFHLPAQAVVVRIARTMDYWRDAVKEVSVSRWLASSQFPAARVHQVAQPIEVSGHPVTFWRFINGRNGGRADIARPVLTFLPLVHTEEVTLARVLLTDRDA